MTDKDLGTAAGDIFAKAFTLGYETGRLIPAGGMALTAEQVEDVRKLSQMDPWWSAEHVEEVQARVRALFPATEPAEEETKAELCAVRLCVLPARHSGVHADREGLRWNNPTSSPVVPAPTETEWQTWQEVPEGVWFLTNQNIGCWMRRDGDKVTTVTGGWPVCTDSLVAQAPFVAAEEG
ncbi:MULTISPECIES: hypothetical protein [Actinomycetes]|uniref:hypothetical protein n=1 Tax=Actinomycetes TaxID=1760 RepID=UPI0035D76E77